MAGRRVAAAWFVVAAVAAVATACSDDGSGGTTTTTSTAAPEEITTTTMSDEDFRTELQRAQQALQAVGDNICAIDSELTPRVVPSNAVQIESFVDFFVLSYETAARMIEQEDPDSAAVLRAGVQQFRADAEAADFSVEFLTGATPEALGTEEFAAAVSAFGSIKDQQCGTATTIEEPAGVPDTVAEPPGG